MISLDQVRISVSLFRTRDHLGLYPEIGESNRKRTEKGKIFGCFGCRLLLLRTLFRNVWSGRRLWCFRVEKRSLDSAKDSICEADYKASPNLSKGRKESHFFS